MDIKRGDGRVKTSDLASYLANEFILSSPLGFTVWNMAPTNTPPYDEIEAVLTALEINKPLPKMNMMFMPPMFPQEVVKYIIFAPPCRCGVIANSIVKRRISTPMATVEVYPNNIKILPCGLFPDFIILDGYKNEQFEDCAVMSRMVACATKVLFINNSTGIKRLTTLDGTFKMYMSRKYIEIEKSTRTDNLPVVGEATLTNIMMNLHTSQTNMPPARVICHITNKPQERVSKLYGLPFISNVFVFEWIDNDCKIKTYKKKNPGGIAFVISTDVESRLTKLSLLEKMKRVASVEIEELNYGDHNIIIDMLQIDVTNNGDDHSWFIDRVLKKIDCKFRVMSYL